MEKKSPDLKKRIKWLHEKTNEPYTIVKEQHSEREDKDEWSVFGELVGRKIRALPTHYTRTTVQHLINNIMWEADMGKYNFPPHPPPSSLSSVRKDRGKESGEDVTVQSIDIETVLSGATVSAGNLPSTSKQTTVFEKHTDQEEYSQASRKDRRKESREDVSVKSADIIDIVSDQSLEGAEESSIMDKTGRTTDGQYEDSFKSAMRDSDASTASNVAETKTEFDVFGSSVAAQLKNMPWENALELQLQIQQLITRYRLNLHKESRTNCSKRPPFELVECGEEPNMGYEEQQVPPVRQPRILECTLEKPKVTGRNANRASLEKKRKRKEEKAATQTTNGDVTSHDGNAETLSSVDATQLKKEMQEVRNKRLRVEQQNNDGGGGGSGASGSTSPEQFAEVLIKEEVMLVDASMAKNVFGEEGELPIVEIKQESSIEDEYNPLGTAATMEEN